MNDWMSEEEPELRVWSVLEGFGHAKSEKEVYIKPSTVETENKLKLKSRPWGNI